MHTHVYIQFIAARVVAAGPDVIINHGSMMKYLSLLSPDHPDVGNRAFLQTTTTNTGRYMIYDIRGKITYCIAYIYIIYISSKYMLYVFIVTLEHLILHLTNYMNKLMIFNI